MPSPHSPPSLVEKMTPQVSEGEPLRKTSALEAGPLRSPGGLAGSTCCGRAVPPAQAPESRRIRSCCAFKTHKKPPHLGVQISRYLALKMDGEYLPVFSCIFEMLINMSKKNRGWGWEQ